MQLRLESANPAKVYVIALRTSKLILRPFTARCKQILLLVLEWLTSTWRWWKFCSMLGWRTVSRFLTFGYCLSIFFRKLRIYLHPKFYREKVNWKQWSLWNLWKLMLGTWWRVRTEECWGIQILTFCLLYYLAINNSMALAFSFLFQFVFEVELFVLGEGGTSSKLFFMLFLCMLSLTLCQSFI